MVVALLAAGAAHAHKCAPLEYVVVWPRLPSAIPAGTAIRVEVDGWQAEGAAADGESLVVRVPTTERERGRALVPLLVQWCSVPNVSRIAFEWDGDRFEARVANVRSTLVVQELIARDPSEYEP